MAVLFLLALFIFKSTSVFKNTEKYQGVSKTNGLTAYGDLTIEDLVNRDTDQDGIVDWEEGLWETDPTKKETTPGVPDSVAINKLKVERGNNPETTNVGNQGTEKLTQTDKFSRELFATVAAASQSGTIDQTTIDALSASLAEHIQNSLPLKTYTPTDIKITSNESIQAIQQYRDALTNIYTKYNKEKEVSEIFEKLIADEENMSILKELDPIINQIEKIISELTKTAVPQSLSLLHLDLINTSQRLLENIRNIKLLENDAVIAMSAIIQYWENNATLQLVASRLVGTIQQKLNN